MISRNFDTDDRSLFLVRRGMGVRPATGYRLTYELVVIGGDIGDVVRSAGGWLYDRVRAGWQVSVVVPDGADVRPLKILGVRTCSVDDPFQVLRGSSPAALAISADVVAGNPQIGRFVERALERNIIEVTLWGDRPPAQIERHFEFVQHPASGADRAFRTHAMAAIGSLGAETDCIEEFHSVALWYPPDGTDLVPVS
jgi:hypothetical protein